MIERFNFYDVYGYLLPGTALLLVVVCPFWLSTNRGPSIEISSALLASVVAYFLGHLLQLLSREALPSMKKKAGRYRLHSSVMLDDDDETWDASFRGRLTFAIRRHLGLPTDSDSQRRVAFEACRQYLQAGDVRSYAEQFQGLYALMRGLFMSAVLGTSLSLGWLIGAVLATADRGLFAVAVGASAATALFIMARPRSRWCFWWVVGTALTVGSAMSSVHSTVPNTPTRMAGLAAVLLVAARYFYGANRFHTEQFARNVYIAFYTRTVGLERSPRARRR